MEKVSGITQDITSDTLSFLNIDNTDENTPDTLYAAISSKISNPDSSSKELPNTFTFTAKVLSETETRTVEGQERVYQRATIARKADKYFLLDVNDLQEYPKSGDIIRVTSTSYSTLDWVVDNKKNSLLSIKADSIHSIEPKTLAANTSPTVDAGTWSASSGTIEFKGAHFSQDPFKKKVVVIYFNYTNTSDQAASVHWNRADKQPYMFMGDNNTCLEDNIFPAKEVDDQALKTHDNTAPGKTTYYYSMFTVPNDTNTSRLYIKRYDDDFNLTDNISIDVAPSLAQMK